MIPYRRLTGLFVVLSCTILAWGESMASPYVILKDGRRVEGQRIQETFDGTIRLMTPQGVVEYPKGAYARTSLSEPEPGKGDAAKSMARVRWLDPDAETKWEDVIRSSTRLSLHGPRRLREVENRKEALEKRKAQLLDVSGQQRMRDWICGIGAAVLLGLLTWGLVLSRAYHRDMSWRGETGWGCAVAVLIVFGIPLWILLANWVDGRAPGATRAEGRKIESEIARDDIPEIERELEELGHLDASHAEGLLEAFGTRYMPNAHAQYQELRARALELERSVGEAFPEGKASDPSGGRMLEKANKKLAEAVAWAFRRRDELCFFLLFHQAGILSGSELAAYDSRPISIWLQGELPDWPDDTPEADTALSAQDATFAAKYLPETQAGYQRLCRMFNEGAKQYAELRRTALELDAPRARLELEMLKKRLEEIGRVLGEWPKNISTQRLEQALGEETTPNLAFVDQSNAADIQQFERKMGLKTFVKRFATRRMEFPP